MVELIPIVELIPVVESIPLLESIPTKSRFHVIPIPTPYAVIPIPIPIPVENGIITPLDPTQLLKFILISQCIELDST